MIDGGASLDTVSSRARRKGRAAVDGLIIGGREVWVLVAGPGEDVASLLRLDRDQAPGAALRLCRGVLEDGVLLLGDSDPEKDPLLSDLMRANHDEDRA